MEMVISIPDDVASKLEERAATYGQTLPAYAAKLVAETVTKPTVDEALGPFRKQVAESGMGDDELDAFLREQIEAHRLEKRVLVQFEYFDRECAFRSNPMSWG